MILIFGMHFLEYGMLFHKCEVFSHEFSPMHYTIHIIIQRLPFSLNFNTEKPEMFRESKATKCNRDRVCSLTLSRVAPSVVSKVSRGVGGLWLWFQILVTTPYLTQIDTRQKDLQLSDT